MESLNWQADTFHHLDNKLLFRSPENEREKQKISFEKEEKGTVDEVGLFLWKELVLEINAPDCLKL